MAGGSSPPPPPDPTKVATAQTAANKETAIANANLNRVDQTNPFGSSNWTVTGTNPDGTPKWSQSTTFSEPLQQNFNTYFGLNNALGQSAQGQLGRVQEMLAKPFDLNTETENRINQMMSARLNPELERQEDALRTRLTNQGIREGTESWDRAMERQGRMATDSRNQMWLSARAQGANEAMTQRQFPLQEFNSLFRGQQPQTPQFSGIPGVNMANTDVAGITQQGYANQLAAYNAQNAQNSGMMGGLFGIGGQLLTAPMTGGGSLFGSFFR
jgi:hypothetical protein